MGKCRKKTSKLVTNYKYNYVILNMCENVRHDWLLNLLSLRTTIQCVCGIHLCRGIVYLCAYSTLVFSLWRRALDFTVTVSELIQSFNTLNQNVVFAFIWMSSFRAILHRLVNIFSAFLSTFNRHYYSQHWPSHRSVCVYRSRCYFRYAASGKWEYFIHFKWHRSEKQQQNTNKI